MISEKEITELEHWMDDFDAELEPLKFFILPSGGKAAATVHVCRTTVSYTHLDVYKRQF